MNTTVQAGAQAPERLRVRIENAQLEPEPLDLTLVTSVTLVAFAPDGRVENWAMVMVEQTTGHLVAERVWQISDIYTPGTYKIEVVLAVSGGVRRAGPTVLEVT